METTAHTHRRRDEGFTLIELMVVVAIIGILAGWAMVDYTGITERQRLHSTIREFVGIYRENRAFAAKERRLVRLEYNLEEPQSYRVLIYPREDESGNWVTAENEILDPDIIDEQLAARRWKTLPRGVFIQQIVAPGPGGEDVFEQDYWLEFRQDGTIPPHILHFATGGEEGLRMSLEIEELTGSVTVRDGWVPVPLAEESDFEIIAGETGEDR